MLSHRLIQTGLIIGLCQRKNSLMWKEFWLKYYEISEIDSEEDKEEGIFDDEGLGNNLRPKSKSAMKVSDQLEFF